MQQTQLQSDQRRLLFMYFWAKDELARLAKRLRAALTRSTSPGADAVPRSFGVALLALSLLVGMGARGAGAAEGPPLVLEATIPLAGTGGRIDHMAVDLRRER